MQHLLTEEELTELKNKQKIAFEQVRADILLLCIAAANAIPVKRHWDKGNVSPWGCILDDETTPGYCDDCPKVVVNMCPYPGKRWSK